MGEHVPPGRETPIVDRAKADDAGRPPADAAVTQLARQLMEAGLDGLSERERRVILLIAKRRHVARDVNSVLVERQTFGERLADRVAQMGGSWGSSWSSRACSSHGPW